MPSISESATEITFMGNGRLLRIQTYVEDTPGRQPLQACGEVRAPGEPRLGVGLSATPTKPLAESSLDRPRRYPLVHAYPQSRLFPRWASR
jgi:hypothetical protein